MPVPYVTRFRANFGFAIYALFNPDRIEQRVGRSFREERAVLTRTTSPGFLAFHLETQDNLLVTMQFVSEYLIYCTICTIVKANLLVNSQRTRISPVAARDQYPCCNAICSKDPVPCRSNKQVAAI